MWRMRHQINILVFLMGVSLCGCSSEDLKPMIAATEAERPDVAAIKVLGYCPRAGFQFKDFWALGNSYKIQGGEMLPDFDRDGIPDRLDNNPSLGINRLQADSNGDGYSDLLMFQGGFDIDSQQRFSMMSCNSAPGEDFDKDGLTDCEEENISHTDSRKFDSDNDGISDGMEIRFGLNPKDAFDTEQNPAGDGINNIDKIKWNLPVRDNAKAFQERYGFVYSITPDLDKAVGCMNLRVSNIPQAPVSNGNLVTLYFFEVNALGQKAMRVESITVEKAEIDIADPYDRLFRYELTSAANWSVQ